jgi:exodeoxyribonuclease VII small subunit
MARPVSATLASFSVPCPVVQGYKLNLQEDDITMATKKKSASRKSAATTDAETINFEKAMAELETLVTNMEKGEQSLEASLKDFERGVELTRQCQQALKAAEQKVQILSKKMGQEDLLPFDEEDYEA